MDKFITTAEAAELIGCNDSRVRQLLRANKVAGKRVGRDWQVSEASARAWRDAAPKPGRVPKDKPAKVVRPRGK